MFNFLQGEIILIDKELGWTSFDVVNYLRPAIQTYTNWQLGTKTKVKLGHAGTLDPLATGLLVIVTGKQTKAISQIQNQPKTYVGSFYLGATTPSFDREFPIDQTFTMEPLTQSELQQVANQFLGSQQQVPPVYSAVHVQGKRAYTLARQNLSVNLSPKPIEIYRFVITRVSWPLVDFEIECSKGTYIRAIARDFGLALRAGAYLHSLRRVQIGPFLVSQAKKVKEFVLALKQLRLNG